MEFAYSDGEEVESRIRDLLASESHLGSQCRIAQAEQVDSWPVRYHLAPERANLLRHLCFRDLNVLELGAGMGGLSRFLAEEAAHLTVVEASPPRLAALEQRLRDLSNWTAWQGRIEAFAPETRYDVVCVVGVLEYAELHLQTPDGFSGDAFDYFLDRAARLLTPDGVLLLAIENRLGLKYWSGAGEDHSGGLFDGIVGYPATPAARTFSRQELHRRLEGQGLAVGAEYFPFPDYKLPNSVLCSEILDVDAELAADLAGYRPFLDPMHQRSVLFPDYLALHSLGKAGLLGEMANSFLVAAVGDGLSPTLASLRGEEGAERILAWHYSPGRRQQVRTLFRRQTDGRVVTEKEEIGAAAVGQSPDLRWTPAGGEVATGERVRLRLLRRLYFGDEAGFLEELCRFFEWLMGQHGNRDAATVRGDVLDALVGNAVVTASGYRIFDREWTAGKSLRASRLVLRNVISLSMDFEVFSRRLSFGSLEELYADLCRRLGVVFDLQRDLDEESEFQFEVTCRQKENIRQELQELLRRPFSSRNLPPRRPDFLWRWEQLLTTSGGASREVDVVTSQQRSIAIQSDSISALQRVVESLEKAIHQQSSSIYGQQATIEGLRESLDRAHQQLAASRGELDEKNRQNEDLSRSLTAMVEERQEIEGHLRSMLGKPAESGDHRELLSCAEEELEVARHRLREVDSVLALERKIIANQIAEIAAAHRTLERRRHRWIEGIFCWLRSLGRLTDGIKSSGVKGS